jgi:hypothetical protein
MAHDHPPEDYAAHQRRKEQEYEAVCCRCGACCGAFDDPCTELIRKADGTCACRVYAQRLGEHQTAGGKKFRCLPIRDIIHMSWDHDHLCAYKQNIRP